MGRLAIALLISIVAAFGCSKKSESKGGGAETDAQAQIQPGSPTARPPRGPLQWSADEQASLARARRENRPVLIDFGAEWCEPCRIYEEKVFTDPAVIERLSPVVLVRFDVTDQTDEHEALQERYGANTLPTLIGLSPAGAEVLRITDLLDPEGFVAALARLE